MKTIQIAAIRDAGKVSLGAGCRKPADAPAAPVATASAVADSGKVRLGAGCRRR
jgi:hypothetical protein